MASAKLVQTIKETRQRHRSSALTKGVNENLLDHIFDLLIRLEQKQSGQAYKFIGDYVVQTDSKLPPELPQS